MCLQSSPHQHLRQMPAGERFDVFQWQFSIIDSSFVVRRHDSHRRIQARLRELRRYAADFRYEQELPQCTEFLLTIGFHRRDLPTSEMDVREFLTRYREFLHLIETLRSLGPATRMLEIID